MGDATYTCNCSVEDMVVQPRAISARIAGVSSQLENPPVNPLTGCGRNAQEVIRREVAAYQSYQRRLHPASEFSPIFQGDYLFVLLAGKPLMQARVLHDCCIDDAVSPNLTFAIGEYQHEAQSDIGGFFGTFTKKSISAYDPRDKRKGGKLVRHLQMSRCGGA